MSEQISTWRIFPVWVVHETVDDRGRQGALIGVFSDEGVANKIAATAGWYGGKGSIVQYSAVELYEGHQGEVAQRFVLANDIPRGTLFDQNIPEIEKRHREEALAKLTPYERKLLKIPENL